jgi:hypothetical protein
VLPSFRRPGFSAKPMTSSERSLEKVWGVATAPARDPLGE